MKKINLLIYLFTTLGIFFVLLGVILETKNDVISIINRHFLSKNENNYLEKNEYYRDYDFLFVQNTESATITNYQDILNTYYTFLNSGEISHEFYCSKKYKDCLKDIQSIADDEDILSTINNYVHPYNNFSNIETEYDSFGKITLKIEKSYNEEQIKQINEKIDELYPVLVDQFKTKKENIKSVHDYIIKTVKYDKTRTDKTNSIYNSDIAYGPLFEGYAICGGYTDLMELFLEKMGIKSYRISSDNHIWNAVYVNNDWYHLDLTWDDPISQDGKNYLEHHYFLITTSALEEISKSPEHIFREDYYQELKEVN